MPGRGAGVLQDHGLEAEADRLGMQAASLAAPAKRTSREGATNDHMSAHSPIQRKVAINDVRAYDGNEVITDFTYNRIGNPGGGNHFFPDKGVSEIVKEIALGQSRDNAYANLMLLSNGLQLGGFGALNNPGSNVIYDYFIDQFISFISNAPKNKFTTENRTGDNHGTTLDIPGTPTAFNTVKAFAHKFNANITAAYLQKGTAATGTAKSYVDQLVNFCNHNP